MSLFVHQDAPLQKRIRLLALVPPLVLAGVILVALGVAAWRTGSEVRTQVSQMASGGLDRAASDFRTLAEVTQSERARQVNLALRVAMDVRDRQGGFSADGQGVAWKAVNQFDKGVREVTLPKMLVGKTWLAQNADPAIPTPLVDEVTRLTGAAATVFQRMDAQGNMLRVATSVKNKEGKRGVGTYIPAVQPDGQPNPVVQKVLRGERFEGRAFVVDAWYLTAYEPLVDGKGHVWGMLFVGVREDSLEAIRAAVVANRMGETGHVQVVGARGAQRGVVVIAPRGHQAGDNLLQDKDPVERAFAERVVDNALRLEGGAVGRAEHGVRRAAYTYFAPWDWVIVAEMDEAEAVAAATHVDRSLLWTALAVLALTVALLLCAAWWARRSAAAMAAPVEEMAQAAKRIAVGDLAVTIGYRGGDEVGLLADAFRATVEYVGEVAAAARAMARGDLSVEPTPRSEQDELSRSFLVAQAVMRRLSTESQALAASATGGRLGERMDPAGFEGAYLDVVVGLNGAVDALVAPLRATAGALDRLARGDLPESVASGFKGDLASLGTSLDACVHAIRSVLGDVDRMAKAAMAGKLDVRADPAPHGGRYRSIVEGFNGTLDALVQPLQRAAAQVERISRGDLSSDTGPRWLGDFAQVQASLERCADAIRRLVVGMDQLSAAAVEGHLSTRADEKEHQGRFAEVVAGVNRTLDALLAPVGEATSVLERLAARDLRARAAGTFAGDHARLIHALNATGTELHAAVSQVAEAAHQVSATTGEIASSSQGVANGAAQQAEAVEASTQALSAISGSSGRAAEAAERADQAAGVARGAASAGASAVNRMGTVMDDVRTATERTAAIIKDINDIAFQTNLLALNAAVEAARAGDAGRAFAVVADEVRSLAMRSKQAAARTESLIKESLSQAAAGAATSREVATRFGEIAGAVDKVTGVVGEIREAAQSQATGFQTVRDALERVDRIAQQNAASAQQTSSATTELAAEAQELSRLVADFKTEGHKALARAS
jgi:methyl-accepting chemotaxis protein